MPTTELRENLLSLHHRCSDASVDCAQAAREMHAVIERAPPASAIGGKPLLSRERLDALLELSAFESAAFELAGNRVGLMLSRSVNGSVVATTSVPDLAIETSFQADDVGLAILAALADALVRVLGREGGDAAPVVRTTRLN